MQNTDTATKVRVSALRPHRYTVLHSGNGRSIGIVGKTGPNSRRPRWFASTPRGGQWTDAPTRREAVAYLIEAHDLHTARQS